MASQQVTAKKQQGEPITRPPAVLSIWHFFQFSLHYGFFISVHIAPSIASCDTYTTLHTIPSLDQNGITKTMCILE